MSNEQVPIRILHVLTAMDRAGTETMLMNIYRSIDRESVQFDFAVTTSEHCDYDDEIRALGGKLIYYPRYTVFNHFSYKKWWNEFFKSETTYKIVHGHIGSTAAIYLKLAKKYGCYAIAHCHSVGDYKSLHGWLYHLFSFRTRYIADYFIGCSRKALISRYGKKVTNDANKCTILKNAIDVSKYTYSPDVRMSVLNELGIDSNQMVIGTVGRLTDAKNVYFIVDIISELSKREKDFIFLWAGTGEEKDNLEEYIREKQCQDCIKLLGVRDDIPRILQAFNVFVLPSKFEGMPVVGIEVQAAGIPTICSDQVTLELKMTDCVSFLPIDSVEPWVEAILKEKTFRRIETAPADVIKAGYDVSMESKKLVSMYRSIYDKKLGDEE